MQNGFNPTRYSVIDGKNPREILLLVGRGCVWRRCAFCNYHLDFEPKAEAAFSENIKAISKVRGIYGRLEVINSGSFIDLDERTMGAILNACITAKIHQIHFECHFMHRGEISALRRRFAAQGVDVKVKIGVETFDADFRERVLIKGISEADPAKIAEDFDECCLLFGISGQTAQTMRRDVETGLSHFERVCINIMQENGMPVHPDADVLEDFMREVLPVYLNNARVDILLENTDFGVGEILQDDK